MNAAQLLTYFDRISDAPDAIPRLRRFILDLAVRGKLVEQDPNDEPASELLMRIQAEKARLIVHDEIPKQRPLPPIDNDKTPFNLPLCWCWVRLNEITSYVQRGKSPKYASHDGLPVISQKCIQWRGLELESAKRITRESVETYETIRFLRDGDLLWNSTGTGTIGRIVRITAPPPKLVCDSHVTVVRCLEVDAEYVRSWLRSDNVYGSIEDRAAGSTNQVELTSQMAISQVVPLPPLAEQHRIVAKVDELMALCDGLEAAQVEREKHRDCLATASLHRLNNGSNAEAFRESAHFHLDHLPRLTARPEHIKLLRQTILNLAVRGKLVPQDPNDEAASHLFNRIRAEKELLTTEGLLKKDKMAWEGLPNKPPYELPPTWIWACLQDVFEISRGGSPRPAGDPRYFGGPIPWITVGEITKDGQKYLTRTESGLTEEGAARSRFINVGDLLLTNSGATLGVPKISCIKACMNDGVAVLRLFHKVPLNDFAHLYLHSQTESFRRVNQGMGQPNLNTIMIAGWYFPLPPLAEQHRIVAKVDELMQLCDQLEAHLTTAQTESRRLLDALLHQALSATPQAA
jgi:type I restriction enzyme S subunit